jgi:hypothetical protein
MQSEHVKTIFSGVSRCQRPDSLNIGGIPLLIRSPPDISGDQPESMDVPVVDIKITTSFHQATVELCAVVPDLFIL